MTKYEYQIGGSLTNNAPSYVVRKADFQLYEALKAGDFCYVLNSRQMGKSSLLVHTRHQLQQAGFKCSTIDMTRIGSENITAEQWYKGIVTELWRGFNLLSQVNLKSWWRDEAEISVLQRLSYFIENVLLVKFPQERMVIFIDEIDSILSLNFSVEDFFALIRFCYNQRAINPEYNRLNFAIFGVATPSDLIADRNRTPFNIGQAIELQGFQLDEAAQLAAGLESQVSNSQIVLREILNWTSGQPFLTQKLCQLILRLNKEENNTVLTIPPGMEEFWVENLVRAQIIHNWESQDEPEHLRTIRDRIQRNGQRIGRLLGIYQQVLQSEATLLRESGGIKTDDSPEQTELILSGLVIKHQGLLRVKNRIYQEVFNLKWVEEQLGSLRPYSQTFDAWIASKQQDESRLLRGQALIDAQIWSQGKSLSDLDYQFLAKSQELDRKEAQITLEAQRAKEVEARLVEEQKTARLQRFFLGAVTMGLLVAAGLGITAFRESRRATVSEIKAIALSSEALFASNKRFDALIQAIKAKKKLQQLGVAHAELETEIDKVLQQAAYQLTESNHLSGHQSVVLGVDFSPDGQIIASSSADGSVKLWQRDGTLVRTLSGQGGIKYRVKFSPDGQIIAVTGDDNTVTLWKRDGRAGTGALPLQTLKGHQAAVWAVAFSPDSQTIATGSADSTVKLWQRNGTLLRTLKGHSNILQGVAFSPDGRTIVSAALDNTIKLWKLDGTLLRTLKGHNAGVVAVALSKDGQTIASASEDGMIKLWRWDGTLLTTFKGHIAGARSLAFSPNGRTLVTGSVDNTAKLWRLDGTEITTLQGHSGGVWGVAFSPDGRTVATASADNTVKLWQPDVAFLRSLKGHSAAVFGVAFSRDGRTIATGGADNTVKLWKPDGTLITTLKGHSAAVRNVAFSPDGQTLATANTDKTIKLWKLDGTELITLRGHSAGVVAIQFSPDGQTLVSGSVDSTAKIWRRNDSCRGVKFRTTNLGKNPDLCFTPTTLKGHNGGVRGVAFSPNGGTLATASLDKTVKLWKLDGSEITTLKGHRAGIFDVQFSPDGQTIATASLDKSVKLWQRDGTLFSTLQGSVSLGGVDFSPDGQIIAASGADGSIALWKRDGRASTGAMRLQTLYGHSAVAWNVAFSPDGKTLASASDDQTAILWDLPRILNLDLMAYSCDRLRDYLKTNADVEKSDRNLCDGMKPHNPSYSKVLSAVSAARR